MNYSSRRKAARPFVLLVLAGVVGVMMWLAHRDQADLGALLAHGATTEAAVTGRHTESGRSMTYYVDYTFTAGGRTVKSSDDVAYSLYRQARVGGPLLVTYLPEHPDTHRAGAVDATVVADDRGAWVLALLLTLVIGGIMIAVAPFYVK